MPLQPRAVAPGTTSVPWATERTTTRPAVLVLAPPAPGPATEDASWAGSWSGSWS